MKKRTQSVTIIVLGGLCIVGLVIMAIALLYVGLEGSTVDMPPTRSSPTLPVESTPEAPVPTITALVESTTPTPINLVTPTPIPLPSNQGSSLVFIAADTTSGQAIQSLSASDPTAIAEVVPEQSIFFDTTVGEINDMDASPNSRWVAVTTYHEHGSSTQVLEVATGRVRQVHPEDYQGTADFLGWAPDGDTAILRGNPIVDDATLLMNLDTGRTENLDTPPYTYDVTLSPDGQHVLYVLSKGFGFGSEMWMMERDGNNQVLVLQETEHIISYPRWSPTGNAIAYILMEDSLIPYTVGELWMTDGEGKSPRRIAEADAGHGYPPVWSPDGRWVAFVMRTNPQDIQANSNPLALESNIYLADAYTGEVRPLTTFEDTLTNKPVWSPDGQWVAFNSNADGTADLWIAEVETGQVQQITHDADAHNPVWLVGEGQGVALAATPTPTPPVAPTTPPPPTPTAMLGPVTEGQTVNPDGIPVTFYQPVAYFTGETLGTTVFLVDGQRRLITMDLSNPDAGNKIVGQNVYRDGGVTPVRVISDLHTVVYVTSDDTSRATQKWPVISLNLDTEEATTIGTTQGNPLIFSVATTGDVLLFEDNHLVLKNVDGSQSRTLDVLEVELEKLGVPWHEIDVYISNYKKPPIRFALSPDGRRIAVFDRQQVRLMTLDGQQIVDVPLDMALADGVFHYPDIAFIAWSPDGRQLAFLEGIYPPVTMRDDPWFGLKVINTLDGTSFYLEPPGGESKNEGHSVVWSPDNQQIAFTYQYAQLYVANADGSMVRNLGQAQSESFTWSADGTSIFYICRPTESAALCVITVP